LADPRNMEAAGRAGPGSGSPCSMLGMMPRFWADALTRCHFPPGVTLQNADALQGRAHAHWQLGHLDEALRDDDASLPLYPTPARAASARSVGPGRGAPVAGRRGVLGALGGGRPIVAEAAPRADWTGAGSPPAAGAPGRAVSPVGDPPSPAAPPAPPAALPPA